MPPAEKPQRLDAILSRYGYCSRREARSWLRSGRVRILGETQTDGSLKAAASTVQIDNEPVEAPAGLLAVLHKPAGVVCSHETREGPSVYDLLPSRWNQRNPPVASVGRLDKDTTGLLLITDSGELIQRWTSPRHKVPKLYQVTLNRPVDPALIPLFAAGQLRLDGEETPCLPATLQIHPPHHATLELTEGRYHQVKRMFETCGYQVTALHRSQFGTFTLGTLQPGQWQRLPFPDA